jgi:hypothetical protein
LSRLVIPTGTKGGVSGEHFEPRRRKVISPGSKVEPGLKARTKASLSTSASEALGKASIYVPRAG